MIGIRGYKVDKHCQGEAMIVIGDELAAKDAKVAKEDGVAARRKLSGSAASVVTKDNGAQSAAPKSVSDSPLAAGSGTPNANTTEPTACCFTWTATVSVIRFW